MENPGCQLRCRPARKVVWMWGFCIFISHILSVAAGDSLIANFPALPNGTACQSVAVPADGPTLLVTVVKPGANPMLAELRLGNRKISCRVIGHDPVTRLGFLQINDPLVSPLPTWIDDTRGSMGLTLRAIAPGGSVKSLATGWVKQIGDKVLPLALMRVNFDETVPLAGTPLMDPGGRVVAIVFQASGSGKTGYAIPAEAVHRVRRDVGNGGALIRGWLGLTLHSESQSPRIVRVLPDSPAAGAAIQPGDVLMRVGSRQVSDYADAANAFFYLVPGQPTQIRILRETKQMELTLTPTRPE